MMNNNNNFNFKDGNINNNYENNGMNVVINNI